MLSACAVLLASAAALVGGGSGEKVMSKNEISVLGGPERRSNETPVTAPEASSDEIMTEPSSPQATPARSTIVVLADSDSPDSPDSFPASPHFKLASAVKKTSSISVDVIRDSDDDDSDDDSLDIGAESLEEAVRYGQSFINGPSSFSSSSSSASLYTNNVFAVLPSPRQAPATTFLHSGPTPMQGVLASSPFSPVSPVSGWSSTPIQTPTPPPKQRQKQAPVTKRRRENTLLTSPLPLRRHKQVCLDTEQTNKTTPSLQRQTDYRLASRLRRQTPVLGPHKKHKFDMSTLLRQAQQDDAAEAAARRAAAILANNASDLGEEEKSAAATATAKAKAPHNSAASFLDDMLMLDKAEGDGNGHSLKTETGTARGSKGKKEGNGSQDASAGPIEIGSFNKNRLRRAFETAELNTTANEWYFFQEPAAATVTVPVAPSSRPFPSLGGSRWSFLADADTRDEYFVTGIVERALRGGRQPPKLPDDVVLWILDEACLSRQPQLRAAYAGVLDACPPEQIRRLVNTDCVRRLFARLGPRKEVMALAAEVRPPRLPLMPSQTRPYPGRDWTELRALLRLLAVPSLATAMGPDAVRCASLLLLYLGLDSVLTENEDLLEAYQEAIRALVVVGGELEDYLHASVGRPALRWRVLASLPVDVPVCHDLRRRLAAVFLFDDPACARRDPRQHVLEIVSGSGVGSSNTQSLARLAQRADLEISRSTDFTELAAVASMLDVYVDDAGRELVAAAKQTADGAALFDAQIDTLADRIRTVGQSIEVTSGGHVARLDSKEALARLQLRLAYAVRTRARPKKNIFDRSAIASDYSGAETRPVQRDIRSFFAQKRADKKLPAVSSGTVA